MHSVLPTDDPSSLAGLAVPQLVGDMSMVEISLRRLADLTLANQRTSPSIA
jgi:hypothetical protein